LGAPGNANNKVSANQYRDCFVGDRFYHGLCSAIWCGCQLGFAQLSLLGCLCNAEWHHIPGHCASADTKLDKSYRAGSSLHHDQILVADVCDSRPRRFSWLKRGLDLVLIAGNHALRISAMEALDFAVGGDLRIVALSGPIFLSQVGTTFSDVFCSIFVLAGVLALYAAGNNRFFLSGLCLGAAVGLKLTCAAYALAMGLTLLLGWRLWQLSPWRYTTFVLGGILGAVITGGYWTWYLYDHKYPNRIDCINKNDLK
jgi:hypothetical protein